MLAAQNLCSCWIISQFSLKGSIAFPDPPVSLLATDFVFVSFFRICECTEAEAEIILQLKSELREKELKLTDIRLEALSSAHHLDQIREAMNRMQVSADHLAGAKRRDKNTMSLPLLVIIKTNLPLKPTMETVCLFKLCPSSPNTEWSILSKPGWEVRVPTGQLHSRAIQDTCTSDWVHLRAEFAEKLRQTSRLHYPVIYLCVGLFPLLLKSDFQLPLPIFYWGGGK